LLNWFLKNIYIAIYRKIYKIYKNIYVWIVQKYICMDSVKYTFRAESGFCGYSGTSEFEEKL